MSRSNGVTNVSAKYPSTTVGIAARISRIGLRTPATRWFAYSLR
jgi:hypothetical protein